MIDDSAQLSIDFLIGFSIFMITLILVATFVSGLLVGLQSRTIDYDAVAYRTGVILTEDPGEPNAFPGVLGLKYFNKWEFIGQSQKNMVYRFGLTPYKSTPHILAQKKIESFGNSSIYNLPEDYRNRVIFGDYPYHYNISVIRASDGTKITTVGEPYPQNSQYGYSRRVVMLKEPSQATFDMNNYPGTNPNFFVDIDTSEMLDATRGPVYWIDPLTEELQINLTNIQSIAKDGVSVTLKRVNSTFLYKGEYIPLQNNLFAWTDNGNSSNIITDVSSYIKVSTGFFIVREIPLDATLTNIRINFDFDNTAAVKEGASYMDQTLIPPAHPDLVPAILEVRIW